MNTASPTKGQIYRLGLHFSKQLDAFSTFEAVASEIGTTKQNAYHECIRALGKLAWLLCQRVHSPINNPAAAWASVQPTNPSPNRNTTGVTA